MANSRFGLRSRLGLIRDFTEGIRGFGELLLLDLYPNAAAAYSLRELSTAFVGQPVVRVRRSSDNVEQDFTATEITDGTLTTFTGANDGFVTTWYDQSGEGNDAIQPTAGSQPKIVDSVNGLILVNNKPAINSVGNKNMQILNTAITNNIDYFSAFSTLKKDAVGFRSYYLGISTGTTVDGSRVWLGTNVGGTTEQIRGRRLDSEGISEVNRGFVSTDQELITSIIRYSLGTAEIYTNGTSNNSGNYGSAGFTSPTNSSAVRLFSNSGNQFFYNNNLQEIIIYTTDQDINKTNIETNINNYYNIF
jgi:hypothetical protein